MPNDVSSGYNTGRIDLSQAPAADMDWDQLFPNPELQNQSAQPQVGSNGTNPQQQPQANQPFLKAGETVYNTAEDAIQGTVHKDQLIANYRKFASDQGLDPNTLQPTNRQSVNSQPQATLQSQGPSPYKYYGNPDYFDQVADAATKRDRNRYEQLTSLHAKEAAQVALQEMLQPWSPILAETTRQRAIRQVSAEIPDFQRFMDSDGYKKVVSTIPIFKEMVQIGENDPVAAQRLPEVYKSMYLTYQGMSQGQAQPTTAPQNTPTVRSQPTLQPSALTPPDNTHNTQGWSESNWKGNKNPGNDARKQLIADGDNKFRGMRFEDVNL